MESHKISVDGEGLRTLAGTCRRNGTQDAWIDIALTWINAAEPEIVRLRADLTAARDAAFAEGLARGKADSERDRQSAAADMIAEERDALQRALNQCRDLLKLECESVEPLRAERDALRHDLERHVAIAAEQAGEIEALLKVVALKEK